MSYNVNYFLKPITPNNRNIQILDDTGLVKYTVNPFSIINTMVSNNVLKINLKNDKFILLNFNDSNEAKSAILQIQSQIDTLTQKTPIVVEKNIENWVEDKLNNNIDYGNINGAPWTTTGITVSTSQEVLITSTISITNDILKNGESIINTYHGTSSTPLQIPDIGYVVNMTTNQNLKFFTLQNILVTFGGTSNGYVWEYFDGDYLQDNYPYYFIGTLENYDPPTGELSLIVTKSNGFGLTNSGNSVPTFSNWQLSITGEELGSTLEPQGENLYIYGDLLPGTTSTYNIGSLSHEWHTLYVGSQSLVIGGVTISSSNGSIMMTSVNLGTEQEPLLLSASGNSLYLNNVETVGGGVSVIEVTYDELTSIIGSASLAVGNYYVITDFKTCYDQPDFGTNNNALTASSYRETDVHPLMVLAISNSELSVDAYQPDYPKDKIKYDFTWNQTEATGGTAYGRITERIDEFNNRTDYDHRNVRFKRYRSRLLDGTVGGRILSMTDGLVIGTNSNFTGNFASGSVVFIESLNPNFYKVTNVVSDTEMTVEGINYDNFNDSIGFSYQQTYLEQYVTPGCLYYFNDSGDNYIEDGGNDMYDDGNYLNTNLYNTIPYTHTQMVGIEGQATLEDFTYDGTVENGDSYFGTASTYFTNTYPGLFVMAAYDVDVENFSITGDVGADGGGNVEVNRYTWEGFTIFVKKIFNAGDPSVNHIIIVNSTDELIERTYAGNTNDDEDEITNLGSVTQIHYLLFGLSSGVKPTDTQIENVYQSYLNIIDNSDINVTLSTLNSDFTTITDNLPPNSVIFTSLEARQTNIADDNLVFREILTFDTVLGVEARNNYIGNACDSWQWDERDFMLPNNVFTNAFDNNVIIYDNHFGDRFVNNTFGDDVYENFVGSDFYNNMCQDRFDRNQIASNFINNKFYGVEFESNSIGDIFTNNIFISNYNQFYDNQIGNDFSENRFFSGSRLHENHIGDGFNSNRLHNQLRKNQIGNDFVNNDIYRQIYDNTIRNNFNNNDIYNDVYDNFIDNKFENNTIGTSFTIGNFEFYKNKIGVDVKGNSFVSDTWGNVIGDNFYGNAIQIGFNRNVIGIEFVSNIIGENFTDNHIGNYFTINTIGNNFQHNRIGNYFAENSIDEYFTFNEIGHHFNNNTILYDFGYGGGQAYGNKIGNYFENNTIGEYFYSNVVTDIFNNNTVGSYFRFNDIKIHNLYNIDFTIGYNNIISFTDNTGASPSIPGTDNVYTGLTVSGGSGLNATFDVTVSSSIVTDVTLNNVGTEYQIGNILTIPYQSFGGTAGFDIEITVGSVSATPHVYQNYNCNLFKNASGNERLSYYDANDVLNIDFIAPYP